MLLIGGMLLIRSDGLDLTRPFERALAQLVRRGWVGLMCAVEVTRIETEVGRPTTWLSVRIPRLTPRGWLISTSAI